MKIEDLNFDLKLIDRFQVMEAQKGIDKIIIEDLTKTCQAMAENKKQVFRREREKTKMLLELGIPFYSAIHELDQKPDEKSSEQILNAWDTRAKLLSLLLEFKLKKDATGIWILRAESKEDPWIGAIMGYEDKYPDEIIGHEDENSAEIQSLELNLKLAPPKLLRTLFKEVEKKLQARKISNIYVSMDLARNEGEYSVEFVQFLMSMGYKEIAYQDDAGSYLGKKKYKSPSTNN